MNWMPTILSLKLAFVVVLLLTPIGLFISYRLSKLKKRRGMWTTIITMPMILPPTVLGFLVLILFSKSGVFGSFLEESMNISVVFSFTGLVMTSVIFGLPFMVQPILSVFLETPKNLIESAQVYGMSKRDILIKLLIPMHANTIISAAIITFANTIGAFGALVLVGGNIASETRVASIALFEKIQLMEYREASLQALILILLAGIMVFTTKILTKKSQKEALVIR